MFSIFKKKEAAAACEMKAAADGSVIPMAEASDPVFASCSLGDGVVIRPSGTIVVAPADGRITATMEGCNHAIGMKLSGGLEILIHVGVDTVNLKGEGFEAFVKSGQKVKAGTKMIRFDREALEAKGYCMEVMQIVLESEGAAKVQYHTGMEARAGETVVASW